MAGVLHAERVWVETFTGLRVTQFSGLSKVVRERGGNGTLRGRPWSLPLADRVLMVAVYYRTNLTMRQLGLLFGVSSSTVCRVIRRLGPLLALESVCRPADAADRLWIVDGTWSRSATAMWAHRHATTGSPRTCRSSSMPTPAW